MDPQIYDLGQAGAGIVALALVVWVVRRVFTHTIPRLAEDYKSSLLSSQQYFQTELAAARQAFRDELAAQRADFREALRDEREELGKRLDRLAVAVETLIRRQD